MKFRLNKFLGIALLLELFAGYGLFVAAQSPPGAYNSPAQGSTSSLPAGLTFVAPTLTVSTAGSGNGQLALSGNTSGASTFTAPAVAGTSTNPVTMSNIIQGPNGVVGTVTYGFTSFPNTGMFTNGAGPLLLASQGTQILNATNGSFTIATPASSTTFTANTFLTGTNCSNSAGTCGSAAAGAVSIAAAATTVTVSTSAVTANSDISLARNDTMGTRLSVTCNTATAAGDIKVSTITPGTSFVITVQNAPVTNPLCLTYDIKN